MKKVKYAALLLMLVGGLFGCGDMNSNDTPTKTKENDISQKIETETTSSTDSTIGFENEKFTLELPADWDGKYITRSEKEEGVDISYVAFFEKGCYEKNETGWLFSIGMYPDDMYLEQPSYEIIKEQDGITYVAIYPSDVQTVGGSKESEAQYSSLVKDVETVVKTLQVR